MPNRRKHDHIASHNFKIEIEGVTQGAFQRVEGVESVTEIIEYQDGDDLILRKRPGRTSYSNIILSRGFVNTSELWLWRKAVMDGKIERKAGSVILLADDASEIMRYNFFEAWPCRWTWGALDGRSKNVAVEEIEVVVERIELG